MKLPLFSLQQAPRTLPIWQCILEDLGHPSAPQLARVLGVGVRTVHRWNRTGNAPRAACTALFWLTRWGRSEIDCRATTTSWPSTSTAPRMRPCWHRPASHPYAPKQPKLTRLLL